MPMPTYKNAIDELFEDLQAAIDATDTPYRGRPVAQLLGHLRWSRPDQFVRWHARTTPSVPETAAALSIDVGMPLPDAMEVVLSALRRELAGEALEALNAYHAAVREVNVERGVIPQQGPTTVTPTVDQPDLARRGGTEYVAPTRSSDPVEEPSTIFVRDPDLVDRGTTAHMETQNEVAKHIRVNGLKPLSPQPGDQQFDVAWASRGTLHICEVKSLTDENQESQLRLGLGQLLSYLSRTEIEHWTDITEVHGVLAVEREPARLDWVEICAEHGVTLTWPERFPLLFEG